MKKIILFVILSINIYGYEISFNHLQKSEETDEKMNYLMLSNIYKFKIDDNLTFRFTPLIFLTNSDDKMYNDITQSNFNKSEIFFKDLYIKYKLDKHYFGFGLLPFSSSRFLEYQNDYIIGGEGLSTLINLNFMNFFYIYENENFKYKTGLGKQSWFRNLPRGNYISEYNDETESIWNIFEYNYNNIKLYNMNIYAKPKYEGITVGDLFLSGFGISYESLDKYGIVLYNILSFSSYKNKSNNTKDKILKNNNLEGFEKYFPDKFDFEDNTRNGYSNLLGIRKDFDFYKEMFINLEWFYASDNWMSVNQGSKYNNSFHTDQAVRNNSYLASLGIYLNKDTLFKISYSHIERKKKSKIGNPTNVIDTKDHFYNSEREKYILINLNYKF